VPHPKNDLEASFSVISTASAELVLTHDHLLLSGPCDALPSLVRAGTVTAGQCVLTTAGYAEVTATATKKGRGV
jgi:hypothetical protein